MSWRTWSLSICSFKGFAIRLTRHGLLQMISIDFSLAFRVVASHGLLYVISMYCYFLGFKAWTWIRLTLTLYIVPLFRV